MLHVRLVFAAALAAALGAASFPAAAENITYTMVDYPEDQNGLPTRGSITTDGTIGAIDVSNIVSWTWDVPMGVNTYTGEIIWTYTSSELSGSSTIASQLSASATEMILEDGGMLVLQAGSIEAGNSLVLALTYSTLGDYYAAQGEYNIPGTTPVSVDIWYTTHPSMGGVYPWVVARVQTPEPSTVVLLGVGVACIVGLRRRKCSK